MPHLKRGVAHFFYSLVFKPKPHLIVNGSTWGLLNPTKFPMRSPPAPIVKRT